MANKKMRKMAVLAKIETTAGTDSTPTGAANAMLVSDVNLTPLEGDEVERNNIKPFFGHSGTVLVTTYKKVSFKIEVAGAGAVGTVPKYAPLLRACGCSVTTAAGASVTFAPVTDGIESVTIYGNVDGTNHVMTSARGECKVALDAKGIPHFEFEFTGLFVPVVDAALPTPDYSGFVAPLGVNKTNTTASLHGVTLAASNFGLTFGNTVVKRDLMSVDSVEITGRKSTGTITFENTLVATKNWIGLAVASTKGALQVIHGITAGNIVEINAPYAQLGKPTFSDSDGIEMCAMPLMLTHGALGNDEWSIVVR